MKSFTKIGMLLPLAILLLSSCGDKPASDQSKSQPLQDFQVMGLAPQAAALYLTFPAVLQGKQNVEIRPKIDGFIEEIYIDEGGIVKKGQKLFKISAPVYDQQVSNASQAVISAQTDVNSAELQVNKTKPLVEKGIISHYELEFAENALKDRQAALAQANANLEIARTNLGYTQISSPVDGIASAIPYKIGSLVGSNNPLPLTTISNNSNIYAYVSLNEKQLLTFSRTYPGNTVAEKIKNLPPVTLTLSDGSIYPQPGKVETVIGLLNTETGSATFRAIFPNPVGLIRSGGSATLRVPQFVKNVLLVPQKSTYELQGKRFIYALGNDNSVRSVEIKVAELTTGQLYVVDAGLKPGDKIVVEGAENLKDGMKINPKMMAADAVYKSLQ
jgi:membrane fusion protein (multidrug efflux system)